jgi:hypothetical protein
VPVEVSVALRPGATLLTDFLPVLNSDKVLYNNKKVNFSYKLSIISIYYKYTIVVRTAIKV